jgi:hypothetical protein
MHAPSESVFHGPHIPSVTVEEVKVDDSSIRTRRLSLPMDNGMVKRHKANDVVALKEPTQKTPHRVHRFHRGIMPAETGPYLVGEPTADQFINGKWQVHLPHHGRDVDADASDTWSGLVIGCDSPDMVRNSLDLYRVGLPSAFVVYSGADSDTTGKAMYYRIHHAGTLDTCTACWKVPLVHGKWWQCPEMSVYTGSLHSLRPMFWSTPEPVQGSTMAA